LNAEIKTLKNLADVGRERIDITIQVRGKLIGIIKKALKAEL
jgi:hypothetical protein